MTSTTPAVKAALKAALKVRLDPLGVEVYRGYPGDAAPDTFVSVAGASGTQDFRALGRPTRPTKDESYAVSVVIQTASTVDGQEDVSAAAYALLGHLETALSEDPTLGGACQVAHVSAWDDAEEPAANGWLCIIEATVSVKARV